MSQSAVALSLGGITFLLTVIWGGPLIQVLRMLKIGKQIRIEGPQRHITKLGTPTMGGWIFVIPVVVITGTLNLVSIVSELNILGRSVLLPLLTMLAYALLGAVDDWQGCAESGAVAGCPAGSNSCGNWRWPSLWRWS